MTAGVDPGVPKKPTKLLQAKTACCRPLSGTSILRPSGAAICTDINKGTFVFACACHSGQPWHIQARILRLYYRTYDKLRQLRREAEADGACHVAKRIHAVMLNHAGMTSGEIAEALPKSGNGSVAMSVTASTRCWRGNAPVVPTN